MKVENWGKEMVLEEESSLRELWCWVKVGDWASLERVRMGSILREKWVLSHGGNQKKSGILCQMLWSLTSCEVISSCLLALDQPGWLCEWRWHKHSDAVFASPMSSSLISHVLGWLQFSGPWSEQARLWWVQCVGPELALWTSFRATLGRAVERRWLAHTGKLWSFH